MQSMDAASDQAHGYLKQMADHWGLLLLLGILSIVLGVLVIIYPEATVVTVAIFFAAWLFVSGIFYVISAFSSHGDTGSRVLTAVLGVLSVIVGFALLRSPFQSVEVLIFVIGVFWVAQGILTLITAFSRQQGRGWALFIGILGIIAGIIVLQYPIDSAYTLAVIGGIWIIILGVMQIVAAFQLRRITSHIFVAPPA
jgi:uncharacterized membrane protein HdeD (DUF308 family)